MEKKDIYFACAIRGEQGGAEEKALIVGTIQNLGHNVLSEVFLGQDLNNNQLIKEGLTPGQIYKQDMNWLSRADVMVADVSRISLGVGMEIGFKIGTGGRVIAVCKDDRFESLSNMLKGCDDPNYNLVIWHDQKDLEIWLEKELGKVTRA